MKPAPAAIFLGVLSVALYIGFSLFTAPAVIAPAGGIALAGLMILGRGYWPVIFVATYATYLFAGAPFFYTVAVSLGYTVQSLVGVALLEYFDFNRKLGRLRDGIAIIGVSVVASAIVPSFGMVGLELSPSFSSSLTWSHWWTGMVLSLLLIGSLLMRWMRPPHRRTAAEFAEGISAVGAVVLISVLLSWFEVRQFANISLIYYLLIPLGWTALRVGPRGMTLALFFLAVVTLSGEYMTAAGDTRAAIGMHLFQTEVFLVIMGIIFLVLVTVEEERKDADKRLTENVGELEHALDRLHNQDEAKNNFLAMLAHELRNPLATIVSNVELLRLGGHVGDGGGESLTVIEQRLESVGRLLDDLLDVSRISENKIHLKKTALKINEIVERATQNVAHTVRNKHQELVVNLPTNDLWVKGDLTRLEQVFTNLLHNASKFTPRNGRITITGAKKDNSVSITVADTGVGIDVEHLPHIFDVFYQGRNKTAEAKSGLGIGLALTRDLVHLHRGTVRVASEGQNRGSEFTVTLPLLPSPVAEVEEAPPVRTQPNDRTLTWEKHVLIVDDNEAATESIAKLLKLAGYSVSTAYTGADAIKKTTEEFKPDAIFLDISLPDMSGHEVARTLRDVHHYDGRIIALSGYGQEEDKQRSYEAGCTHHLTKPVRLAELREALS
jgi:signal transduction histidine kinase/CheY-like chemotaxis protein